MSYLGLHIASAKRPRFGEYLDLAQAGSPISCVVTLDQNVHAEVKSKSPSTMTFWRTHYNPMGEDNPQGFMDIPFDQMKATAQKWMAGLKPLWDKNKHDALIINNEQDIGTLEHGDKLNIFNLECMRIAESWGTKLGICSFSTGNPSDDGGLTLEQRWQSMLPAIEQCINNGHYLILHAHAHPQSEHFGDTGFRHERSLRYFESQGLKSFRRWVVLGEWSNGVGGVENNLTDYMNNVKAWDTYAMNSVYSAQLVGAALYGFNAAETLDGATTALLDWIRTHPQKVSVEPPVTSVTISVTPRMPVKVYQYPWLQQATIYAPSSAKVEIK